MKNDLSSKNNRIAFIIFAIVAFMIGLSFAAVPLYNLFCKVTGFGGTTQVSEAAPTEVLDRVVNVKFITSTAREMPWQFGAERRSIDVKVGQDVLVNFKAYNPTSTAITGTAIYNVTPLKAGKYFNKTQCFCFDRQTLTPKEHINMPVIFYIDPAMDSDPDMEDVTTITLSYTFFKSDSQDLEKAIEAYGE